MSTQTTEFKSTQGQQAGTLRLSFEELTENEQKLVMFLDQEDRPVFAIKEIMEGLNWHRGPGGRAKGNSRVRNTLRRLVRAKWVSHETEVGDGKYRLSLSGKNRLDKLAEEAKVSPAPAPRKHKPKKAEPTPEVQKALEVLAKAGVTVALPTDEQEF